MFLFLVGIEKGTVGAKSRRTPHTMKSTSASALPVKLRRVSQTVILNPGLLSSLVT